MRFLADESCDFGVVRSLREAGFDVMAICEISPRATDDAVIDLAIRDNRLLLTEDKDFGQLMQATAEPSAGVILLRFPARVRKMLPEAVLRLVRERADRLSACFAVVQPGRIRISRTVKRSP